MVRKVLGIMGPGIPELLLILFIVLLLFGVGRVAKVGGELGSAVANFRKGLNDGKASTPTEEKDKNS